MSDASERFTCRQCGDEVRGGADDDRRGWCESCRRSVVRRSGGLAVIPGVLLGAAYFWMIDYFDMFKSNFVIIWIALGLALGYVTFKIARRVLFDVIRARTVRRPAG
jgi:hypothetical protein